MLLIENCRKVPSSIWVITIIALCCFDPAFAAGSGMPWEGPLQKIVQSVESEIAKGIGIILIVYSGFKIAQGEMGGGMKLLFQIMFGLTIAFTAGSFFLTFFSFGGGALI